MALITEMTPEEIRLFGVLHDFANQMVMIRDMLNPIVSGEIERGHCVGQAAAYGGTPGKRKTMLKDAVKIAKRCQNIINREVNKAHDRSE